DLATCHVDSLHCKNGAPKRAPGFDGTAPPMADFPSSVAKSSKSLGGLEGPGWCDAASEHPIGDISSAHLPTCPVPFAFRRPLRVGGQRRANAKSRRPPPADGKRFQDLG